MRVKLPVLFLVTCASLIPAAADVAAQEAAAPAEARAVAERRSSVPGRVGELLSAAGVHVEDGGPPPDAARAGSHREVRVTWEAERASPPGLATARNASAPGRVTLSLGSQRREGGLPKRRSAELSPNHLMLVAVDAGGRLRWWGLIDDPRILRAEWPGDDGELTGRVLYKETAEFAIQYPDDESIAEIRLYRPDWDGKGLSLKSVGSVAPSGR